MRKPVWTIAIAAVLAAPCTALAQSPSLRFQKIEHEYTKQKPSSLPDDRASGVPIPNSSYGWMSNVSPLDALMSVKIGTFREFPAVHGLVTKLALGVAPLLERQTSRRHLIFGPAIGTFEDNHRFTMRLRLMM